MPECHSCHVMPLVTRVIPHDPCANHSLITFLNFRSTLPTLPAALFGLIPVELTTFGTNSGSSSSSSSSSSSQVSPPLDLSLSLSPNQSQSGSSSSLAPSGVTAPRGAVGDSKPLIDPEAISAMVTKQVLSMLSSLDANNKDDGKDLLGESRPQAAQDPSIEGMILYIAIFFL